MINLPVIDRLDVIDYGLFPGTKDKPGMHISFLPGLTLVLGANGLGKTTLVNMLYRLLTGPSDIPVFSGTITLGSASIQSRTIPPSQKTIFAQRVIDGAREASARISFTLGNHQITVERALNNLQLVQFKIDDIEQVKTEEVFQQEILNLVGVWAFGDWILLLRHIMFYFEDRRSLVWDPSAQRQLLRILFLPIDLAKHWAKEERDILELDSKMRNLRNVLNQSIRRVGIADIQAKNEKDVIAELEELNKLQESDLAEREELNEAFNELGTKRGDARQRLLAAEQERETRYRELERARLMAIEARFPNRSESARYILAQLLTSSECLFCGNKVPKIATEMKERISSQQCIICGSDLAKVTIETDIAGITDKQVSKYIEDLSKIEIELEEAQIAFNGIEAEYKNVMGKGAELDRNIARRTFRIEGLMKKLPPEEAERLKQHSELANLKRQLEVMQSELVDRRENFSQFIRDESHALVEKAQEIQTMFNYYSKEFLFDDCILKWSPRRETIGQGGMKIDFPAFDIELGGTNFPSPVKRSGPDQVSESQREFIELAFRMALMQTATCDNVGSLIIDAPESSLDAVFSVRAAEVLGRFAQPEKNN